MAFDLNLAIAGLYTQAETSIERYEPSQCMPYARCRSTGIELMQHVGLESLVKKGLHVITFSKIALECR